MNQDEKKEYRVTKLTKNMKRNRNVINNILLLDICTRQLGTLKK